MKFRFLFFTILIFSAFSAAAQTASAPDSCEAYINQNRNLDSLVNSWYFKRAEAEGLYDKYELTQSSAINSEMTEEEKDSLYISRLKKVPALFPLSYNDKVKAWIELYTFKNRRTPHLIGMSDYYFPIFEEILDRYGLPVELKYLPVIESALNPKAKSRAGAVGLWQFLYSTGKMYGLEINSYVDERKDPLKSSHAAANFLKDMYEMYGDWALVIAGYNCGPGNVNKAIRRAGGERDFWKIYPYLPRETRGYVPAFIGALYAMTYYKEHNITPVKPDMNIFTDTVMIKEKVHLMQIAEVMGIEYEELQALNPQYRKNIIPGHARAYPLRLPVMKTGNFIALQDSVYAYKDSIFFGNRRVVVNPPRYKRSRYGSYSYGTSKSSYSPPSTSGKKKLSYTVKSGDTFGFIAGWYDVRVSDLKHWNNRRSNRLNIGDKLTVWVPIKKYDHYKRINLLSFQQKQGLNTVASANTRRVSRSRSSSTVSRTSRPGNGKYVWYRVRSGDNLWTIAQRYSGISDKDIKRINGFSNYDVKRLQTGQYIKIKRK